MKKPWAEWEVRYLRDHWLEIGDKGLAKRLGRSLYSVQISGTAWGSALTQLIGQLTKMHTY